MDVRLNLDFGGETYTNDSWKQYDRYCFDKFGSGDAYINGWRDTLINDYKATIHNDQWGDRYVIMPEEYYTLFLIKWSK